MATKTSRAALLAAFAVAALTLAALRRDDQAQAQSAAPPPPAAGRFQISAYSGQTPEGLNPGCYIVDTATGKVWHTRLGAGLVEVTKQRLIDLP
jgi:ABC-type transport system substrate-binding protein